MNILGIGGSSHDFSACIWVNDQLKYAIEDERLTRVKHSLGLDIDVHGCQAVDYCLAAAGVTIDEVDLIIGNDVVNRKYYRPFHRSIKLINHHLAHAASAFYPSAFDEAAILIVDGAGSAIGQEGINETITYYYGKNTEIQELKKVTGQMKWKEDYSSVENSVGYFYDVLSHGIGFFNLENGKTMGLAPYGTPKYVDEFKRFFTMDDEGNFTQTKEHIREMKKFIRHTIALLEDQEAIFQEKADIAFAGQYHLEQIMIKACRYLYSKTKTKHLCLAGGVALNSVANYKILEQTPFEQLFIQPAAGDAGTSIGSALYGYHELMQQPRVSSTSFFSPYLGVEYSEQQMEETIRTYQERLRVRRLERTDQETASLIAEGNIIGWFQGCSEIGPRALGNRSILADPRRKDMKDTINARIKHREPFRPFAPIVLEEKQHEYFSMHHPSYYMLLVPYVLENKRALVPSITHTDGTGRVQTVSRQLNPKLHQLLTAFDELTGVPVLLNTSFNDNGEPIVESPADAIECFLKIDLDYLIIGDYLLSKRAE